MSFLPRRSRALQDRGQALADPRDKTPGSKVLQSQRREMSVSHAASSNQNHPVNSLGQRQQDKRLHRWIYGFG